MMYETLRISIKESLRTKRTVIVDKELRVTGAKGEIVIFIDSDYLSMCNISVTSSLARELAGFQSACVFLGF
jgi:hypothetical protein